MSKLRFSNRELDVMEILWNQEKPMTASQIVDASESLKMSTVQVVLKGLLKKEVIEVADIVYSGTVLSRSFRPVITAEEYIAGSFFQDGKLKFSLSNVVAAFLDHTQTDEQTIKELEEMLEDYKKHLNK